MAPGPSVPWSRTEPASPHGEHKVLTRRNLRGRPSSILYFNKYVLKILYYSYTGYTLVNERDLLPSLKELQSLVV